MNNFTSCHEKNNQISSISFLTGTKNMAAILITVKYNGNGECMDRNSTNDEIGKQILLPLQFHPTSLLK
jgi:hypothetical protein